jgi:hypothetical protein
MTFKNPNMKKNIIKKNHNHNPPFSYNFLKKHHKITKNHNFFNKWNVSKWKNNHEKLKFYKMKILLIWILQRI